MSVGLKYLKTCISNRHFWLRRRSR